MANPLIGGKFFDPRAAGLTPGAALYSYAAGTLTPLATYTDQGGGSSNTNPVILNVYGQADVFLGTAGYRFRLYSDTIGNGGVLLWDEDNIRTLDGLIAGTLSASEGAGVVGFNPVRNYVALTIGAAFEDDLVNVMWFITSETDRQNIKAKTSVVDHTAIIQAALTQYGRIRLAAGRWNLNGELTGATNGCIVGMGIGATEINCSTSMTSAQAAIKSTSATSFTVADISILGNTNGTGGAGFGIKNILGTSCHVVRVRVQDTTQAGVWMDDPQRCKVLLSEFHTNGRVGYTDNHAIMFTSTTSAGAANNEIGHNFVKDAYRKGITLYFAAPGSQANNNVHDNVCTGCATTSLSGAGIYVANAPTTATITVTIASPGVFTWNSHGFPANQPVSFTTTGALPTGLVAGTVYFVVGSSIAANTFQVSATPGGSAINTSGSQSGVHTGSGVPFGTALVLANNICFSNYVNYDINNTKGISGAGNISRTSYAASGVIVTQCEDVDMPGFIDTDAKTKGFYVFNSLRVTLNSITVSRPNRSNIGFGPGIEFSNVFDSIVSSPTITDDSVTPLMTYGFIETGNSDGNRIGLGVIKNATASNITVLGANTEVTYPELRGSAVYDPGNLVDGAGVTTTVTVTGAALGDFASATFSLDLQGITLTAWVSSANTVSVRFQNESGGAIDLASGTIKARVYR